MPVRNTKKVELDEYEQGIIINALNLLRNKQIREKGPTDPVDDLIMKIIEKGPKNLMVAEKGASYGYSR
jgi:3-deoxy-D-manno-octulosonic acid (KDO) 8-phosphate synthase